MKLSESSNKYFIRLGDGHNQDISFLVQNFCVAYEFTPWCDVIQSLFTNISSKWRILQLCSIM